MGSRLRGNDLTKAPNSSGVLPIKGTPEDFGRVIAEETAKWQKVVVSSGATAE